MFSEKVINLFANAENVGILNSATAVGVYTNDKNEVFKLYLKIEDGKIINASFKAYTGVIGVAMMSIYAEMLKGLTMEEAEKVTSEQVLEQIGNVGQKYEYLASDVLESYKVAIEEMNKKKEKEAKKKKSQE